MKIIEEFYKSLEMANKSIHTIRGYKKDVDKFSEFFNIETIEDIAKLTQSDYREFIGSQDGLSPNSLNGLIRNLSVFHRWLEENEYVERSAFFKVKFGKSRYVKVEKEIRDVLTSDEISALIKAGKNSQEKFMIALMVFTAIRRDEVCKIKLSDVVDNKILIHGKGNRQRNIYMNKFLMRLYRTFMNSRTRKGVESEYLFYYGIDNGSLSGVTVNNRILRAVERAGINKKITAHSLRRTAITRIISSKDILTASKVAGHSDLKTTQIYDMTGEEIVKRQLLSDDDDFGKDFDEGAEED
jgi:integrase/recombinase XerD